MCLLQKVPIRNQALPSVIALCEKHDAYFFTIDCVYKCLYDTAI